MIRRTGNIWLFLAKSMLFLAALCVFFIGRNIFYSETLFYFWGNFIIILLYAAPLLFTCKIYNSLLFGGVNFPELILSWLLCLIITNVLEYLQLSLLVSKLLSAAGFFAIFFAQLAIIIPATFFIDKFYYYLNPAHKAVIIYSGEEKAAKYRKILKEHHKKFEVDRIVPQSLPRETLRNYIDESESVFFLDVDESNMGPLLEYCYRRNKRIYILPTFSSVLINTAKISWISNTPMFLPQSPVLDLGTRTVKRCMDILISLLALVLLGWLMLIVLCVIRVYDRQPAIYRQVRVTRGGKLFTLYKFRSMRIDAEDDGVPRLAAKDDSRITAVGRFIRKTRIDELPQLFNVLFGSMSLVGPRPERPEIAKKYEAKYPNFSFRTKVKAGITGFAQIYGRYNTDPDEKLFLDIMYIESFSIWQDLKLILQTVKIIFMPSSAEGIPQK